MCLRQRLVLLCKKKKKKNASGNNRVDNYLLRRRVLSLFGTQTPAFLFSLQEQLAAQSHRETKPTHCVSPQSVGQRWNVGLQASHYEVYKGLVTWKMWRHHTNSVVTLFFYCALKSDHHCMVSATSGWMCVNGWTLTLSWDKKSSVFRSCRFLLALKWAASGAMSLRDSTGKHLEEGKVEI